MTIRRSIDAHALNERLSNLERCAEEAPEGTYAEARAVAGAIGELADHIMRALRAIGLKARGDDTMREVEAVIYGYVLASNPEAYGLVTGEGFGEHVAGPARERVIAQAIGNQLRPDENVGGRSTGRPADYRYPTLDELDP